MPQEIGEDGMPAMPATGTWQRTHGGDPHVPHQGADVSATHPGELRAQEAAQHPRPGEREVHTQCVEAAHEHEIARRDRAWRVVHAAPADPERRRLARHGQRVRPVDHRLALGRRDLPSACSEDIILERELADIGVERLLVDPGVDWAAAEDPGCTHE